MFTMFCCIHCHYKWPLGWLQSKCTQLHWNDTKWVWAAYCHPKIGLSRHIFKVLVLIPIFSEEHGWHEIETLPLMLRLIEFCTRFNLIKFCNVAVGKNGNSWLLPNVLLQFWLSLVVPGQHEIEAFGKWNMEIGGC